MLDRARGAGEMVSFEELRTETGVGHDDMTDVLNVLRERGDAIEGAPGEWRRPFDDELEDLQASSASAGEGEEEPVVGAASERSSEDDLSEFEGRLRERRGRAVLGEAVSARLTDDGEVRLTVGVAVALGPEALGKLVEAGIAEAKAAERPFVLRVS